MAFDAIPSGLAAADSAVSVEELHDHGNKRQKKITENSHSYDSFTLCPANKKEQNEYLEKECGVDADNG